MMIRQGDSPSLLNLLGLLLRGSAELAEV